MAPEQHTQMPTDERTDQFSFSVALWEALFAERPFAGDSPLELAEAVVVGRIRPMPRRPRLPGWLRRALRRGLAISPGDRFPTMRALLDAIRPRRSRVRLALAAAALVVLTGGVAFALQADDEAPDDCAGQRGKLEAVWNPERRAHLRARLAAGPQGAARASLVEQALDRYAAGWQRMAADACTAGQRGAESAELIDLRAHCLDTRLADLQQVIALLDTSDPLVADNAVASVDGLAPVERCSAVEVVEARVPVPSDPADRARVEELRRQLVRADALRLGGRYGEARALLEDLDRRAAELGYRPLVADVLYYLGALQVSTGRAADGEATLRRAAHAAEASRYDQLAADAWILLIETATQSTGDLDKAAEYAEHARAALDRLGSPARLQGQFEHHLGILSWARSRLDEALANFTSARRRLEQIGEAATALAADEGIGLVYEEQGKLAESLEVKQRVLAAREKLYGADHPDVAISLNNMASTLMLMGRSEEALAAMQRVLSIRERANGPEHLETGQALHNMGELLRHLGRYAEALDHHRRARAIFERDSGPENQIVAQSLENTAGVYLDMGQVDEALPRLRRALAMYRKALGDENLDTVRGLINLADGLREAGQFGEALALDQEAVATLDRASGLDTMHGAHAHFGLGLDLLGLGRAGEARPPLERAATTLERIGGDPIALAQAHFGLARALWRERGERPRARELAESALRALDAAPGADPRLRAKVSAWMRTHAK
jgi:eukaryotic-like serine/threonine-protein kinase